MYNLFHRTYTQLSKWLRSLVAFEQPSLSYAATRLAWAWLLLKHSPTTKVLPSSFLLDQLTDIWFCNSCCSNQWDRMPHWINLLYQRSQATLPINDWFDTTKLIRQLLAEPLAQSASSKTSSSIPMDLGELPAFCAIKPPWMPNLWLQLGEYWLAKGGRWYWQLPAVNQTSPATYQCTEDYQAALFDRLITWLEHLTKSATDLSSTKVGVVVADQAQAKYLHLQLSTVLSTSWHVTSYATTRWQELVGWPNINQCADISAPFTLTQALVHLNSLVPWNQAAAPKPWLRLTQDLMLSADHLGELPDNQQLKSWLKLLFNEAIDSGYSLTEEASPHHLNLNNDCLAPPSQAVQIVTIEEVYGNSWDYLWFWQLDRQQSPIATNPLIIISSESQAQWQLPFKDHATRARYISELIDYLFTHTTGQIINSYYLNNSDGSRNLPSQLWEPYRIKMQSWSAIPNPGNHYAPENRCPSPASIATPWQVDPLKNPPDTHCDKSINKPFKPLKISSRWLAIHSRCAFRAYLSEALGLNKNQLTTQSVPFTTPATRGTILHKSLASFWRQVGSWHTLNSTPLKQLEEIMQAALLRTADTPLITVTQIELNYFQQLLKQYLLLELQREPFKVIAVEQEHELTIQGVTISLRVDRIDELANGDRVLIDYKTGQYLSTPWQWLSVPIRDPQIPLYCLALDNYSIQQLALVHIYSTKQLAYKWHTMQSLRALAIKQELIDHHDQSLTDWWLQQFAKIITEIENKVPIADSTDAEYCRSCPYRSCCHALSNPKQAH